MNERTVELYKQATEFAYNSIGREHANTAYFQGAITGKFAELIVRECADIVEQDMKLAHIQMIPLTLEKYANGRLKEKIREHFGVEE